MSYFSYNPKAGITGRGTSAQRDECLRDAGIGWDMCADTYGYGTNAWYCCVLIENMVHSDCLGGQNAAAKWLDLECWEEM